MNTDTAQTPNLQDQLPPQDQAAQQDQASMPAQAPEPAANASSQSERLEDQNVFFMLGVKDGTNEQREEFLDELQQVIWQDFLDYDVKLLLTQEEYQEFENLLKKQAGASLEQQEELVVYLEKLIPELEEIMLEKALELKADLFRERITGMREYYANQADIMQKLQRAEELITQERWYSAAVLLNEID